MIRFHKLSSSFSFFIASSIRLPSIKQLLWLISGIKVFLGENKIQRQKHFGGPYRKSIYYSYIYSSSFSNFIADVVILLCVNANQIGPLKKGLNPPSLSELQFGDSHLMIAIKTGIITGIIAMAVRHYRN